MNWALSRKDLKALEGIKNFSKKGESSRVFLSRYMKVTDDQASKYVQKYKKLELIELDHNLSGISPITNRYQLCFKLTKSGEKLVKFLSELQELSSKKSGVE